MKILQYHYHAYNANGQVVQGQIGAATEQEVVTTLQLKKLIAIKISPIKERTPLFQRKSIKNDIIVDFTNALCTLVEAHVPLDRSLTLLEGITENQKMQQLIGEMRREIKDGKSLADSMEIRPNVFSKTYVNMIRAGEEGGILDQLLPTLSNFLKESAEIRSHVISTMIYPIVLMVVGILSVVLLLVFVVPQFAAIFSNTKGSIPDSAAFLMGVSAWLKNYGLFLVPIPLVMVFFWQWMGRTPERKRKKDSWLLKIPIFGKILLYQDTANFSRTLGALLNAGTPLIRGLKIASAMVKNHVLLDMLSQVENDVRAGSGLGYALEKTGRFPLLMHQLILVGEESGKTALVLSQLAKTFDGYVKIRVTRLVSFLEPAMILTLGFFIGGIVVTMLTAVFSMNDVNF